MTDALAKFQQLLRELFQFDAADLDFGIYRIMNHKRDVVERFITADLPHAVTAALDHGALAEQTQAAHALQETAAQIRENFGADALAADGTLVEAYHATPLGKKYSELRAKIAGSRGRDALEAAIYNHLLAFFSRYYQDGDFISKRRYSRRERYAIPYNGEEVTLYWANHDQYYIKTAEHFTDYTFTAANGVTVHFKLQTADVEQGNIKGEKRFFLPRPAETTWDATAAQLVIPFEFRPLTGQETITYGGKNQQEAILTRVLADIPMRLSPVTAAPALAALTAEKRVTADGKPVTTLAHHLRQYTQHNTADFFIHKNLGGFLTRELDFYLKNEVLNLDDLAAGGEARAEGWFQIMQAIRAVGGRIIEFLAQVEEFQKMLWEKRKFITETFYCVTVGSIGREFLPEIVVCDAQWDEWRTLFHIDEKQADLFEFDEDVYERRKAFLQAHPTLVVDTRRFDADFVDRLLGSYDDLDDVTDGLLVHSENWQALNLIQAQYQTQVDFIYIDPPYNTAATPILYKNDYKESSWLSLLDNRLRLAAELQHSEAAVCIAIDDMEQDKLSILLRTVYIDHDLFRVVVNHYPGSGTGRSNVTRTHEYALFMVPVNIDILRGELVDAGERERNFRRSGTGENNYRIGRPNSFYAILVEPRTRIIVGVEPPPTGTGYPRDATKNGYIRIYPIGEDGSERVWSLSYEAAETAIASGLLRCTDNMVINRVYNDEERRNLLPSLWTATRFSAVSFGTNLLTDLFNTNDSFSYPKSLYTVDYAIEAATHAKREAIVLDYFAGSGTTGHATIHRNRCDGGKRKFILVEMADYFDTVLLPRIKKVTYTPEWRDGKPKRMATAEEAERGPRIVKVVSLESYEDALNNIVFDAAAGQQAMQFEDYLLRYMLKWEARGCETLLNVEKLASPFRYTLQIHADGRTREKPVDIPETFAYLLGLHVQARRTYDDGSRHYLVYRGTIDHRTVAVIWRKTEGWGQADYERNRQFVAEHKLVEGADEVFVNGDSFIPGARALEPIFKARMFAAVEA